MEDTRYILSQAAASIKPHLACAGTNCFHNFQLQSCIIKQTTL